MLALLGAATIAALLAAILSDVLSPLVALVLVPGVAGLIGGFGERTGALMVSGVTAIAPVAAMFVFAILFFGVLTDAGTLDPIIGRVLRLVGEKPARIAVGTALLALLVHLDGSGAVCFLVVVPALLPLYDRLRMDRRVLACVASMAAGVNFLPWTGPMVRSSAALKVPVMEIFRPMIGVQAVGLAFVFATAWWLGHREALRLRVDGSSTATVARPASVGTTLEVAPAPLRRPRLFWLNLTLAVVVMAVLVAGVAAPAAAFMTGAGIALVINYPRSAQQRERIDAHAKSALMMAAILLAAGAFIGFMRGSGALAALAQAVVAEVPSRVNRHVPFVLSLLSMPLSMLFDPDSFYFGVMPVIAEMHGRLGGAPIQVAQAALVGQMTAGFPVSPLTPATFLVCGLAGLELSAHQRFSFGFLYLASLVMAFSCVLFGLFPI